MIVGLDHIKINKALFLGFFFIYLIGLCGCEETIDPKPSLMITSLQINNESLLEGDVDGAPIDKPIIIAFSQPVDTSTVSSAISFTPENGLPLPLRFNYTNKHKNITIYPKEPLKTYTRYTVGISDALLGATGKEKYAGGDFSFTTIFGKLRLESFTAGSIDLISTKRITNVPLDLQMRATFSDPLDVQSVTPQSIKLKRKGRTINVSSTIEYNVLIFAPDAEIDYLTGYELEIDTTLKGIGAIDFDGFKTSFFTELDSTLKFPEISDDELMTKVQQQTFKFFYDHAGPTSGMSRERNNSGSTVTSGGSGFGIMSLIVGMERGFITREQGLNRIEKILTYLERADRFHGVYAHWMDDVTGRVIPFSQKDNGGDLVETSFLFQGLLTFRQYMQTSDARELAIIDRINVLWGEVEWDWHTRGGQNVLYWHWSPNYGWDMNFALRGYYEAMITYVLAASSTTHSIAKEAYHQGWMRSGGVKNGKQFFGITLPLGYDYGGPLFFAHYSFLGLDPRNLSDAYGNYWEQNVAHSLINYEHCIRNPRNHINYNGIAWGLTASDQPSGYGVHEPTNDNGTISPTAALSSFPYTPEESIEAMKYFYYILGDKLWGEFGFYDAYNVNEGWWASSTLAIDQGPIIVMIENHRTGLLWDLFMSAPEVQSGLTKLEIAYE